MRSPLLARLIVVASALVVVATSCGRTAAPEVVCPQPADGCDELREQQASVEAAYAAAAADKDAAVMDEAAQCAQLFVDAALDQACVAGCDELCRLHPCAVVDDDGNRFDPSTCPDRCEALVDDGAISAAALDDAAVKAAENPGFCSCRVCTAVDDALCTRLFDCALE